MTPFQLILGDLFLFPRCHVRSQVSCMMLQIFRVIVKLTMHSIVAAHVCKVLGYNPVQDLSL